MLLNGPIAVTSTLSGEKRSVNELFTYHAGDHGLTDQVMYEYQPTGDDERIPVFSGSRDNKQARRFIRRGARTTRNDVVTVHDGPCLILTKDGSAGIITYKGPDEHFAINHHACVLKLKDEWKKRVHLRWFAWKYRDSLKDAASRSDNQVLSKTATFDKVQFLIPDNYDAQKEEWEAAEKLRQVRDAMRAADVLLNDILSKG